MSNFFGRDDLLENMETLWEKSVASLVTCRGRRRIGKSTLITRFAEISNARLIKIEGLRPESGFSNADELNAFAEQLSLQTNDSGSVPENWLAAFKRLSEQIDNRRTVVLLDEVSWMAYYDHSFAAKLKIAWDNIFKAHDHLILVICGSVSTWIKENIIDNKAYYGRRSLDIIVPELPLKDCVRFWGNRSNRISTTEIIDVLSVTGGVPRYLEEIVPSLSAAENIRRMAFCPNAILRRDFDEMFVDVITKQPKFSARVLETLIEEPKTGVEIAKSLGIEKNGRMADALEQLVEAGIVARDIGKNPETGVEIRERRYRLCDNYVRFYLKFIRPAAQTIDSGAFALSKLTQLDGWNSILGLAFENLIVNHCQELLPHLHMDNALVYSAAPYRRKGARRGEGVQIDMLIQTRRSQCVIEVKRQRRIRHSIVKEVADKVAKLKCTRGNSLRTALVYDGELDDTVVADGYFDAIVPFRKLAGMHLMASDK